jgi:hypothetical protein
MLRYALLVEEQFSILGDINRNIPPVIGMIGHVLVRGFSLGILVSILLKPPKSYVLGIRCGMMRPKQKTGFALGVGLIL